MLVTLMSTCPNRFAGAGAVRGFLTIEDADCSAGLCPPARGPGHLGGGLRCERQRGREVGGGLKALLTFGRQGAQDGVRKRTRKRAVDLVRWPGPGAEM